MRHNQHVHLPSKVSPNTAAWICRRTTDKRSPRLPWIPKGGGSTKKGPMKPLLSTPMLGCNTWICTILCVLVSPRCAAPGAPASLPSGGGRGPGAKLAAARSGGPAGEALALPGPHPGALSIPGLLQEWPLGGCQVAYITRIPPHLDPVGEASSWEPPAEPPAHQTDSPGKTTSAS
jgi:hypothetical protein